jgi:hypothetical protein
MARSGDRLRTLLALLNKQHLAPDVQYETDAGLLRAIVTVGAKSKKQKEKA